MMSVTYIALLTCDDGVVAGRIEVTYLPPIIRVASGFSSRDRHPSAYDGSGPKPEFLEWTLCGSLSDPGPPAVVCGLYRLAGPPGG
jgi:hypothetical protein